MGCLERANVDYETVDLLRTQAVATSHATCTISENTGINIILLPVPFHATGGLKYRSHVIEYHALGTMV